MKNLETDILLPLVDAVYGCASSTKGWDHFLKAWSAQFPSLKSAITSYDASFSRLNFAITEGFDPDFLGSYASTYYQLNPWKHVVENLPAPPNVAWVHDYLPTADLKRTQFYNRSPLASVFFAKRNPFG